MNFCPFISLIPHISFAKIGLKFYLTDLGDNTICY